MHESILPATIPSRQPLGICKISVSLDYSHHSKTFPPTDYHYHHDHSKSLTYIMQLSNQVSNIIKTFHHQFSTDTPRTQFLAIGYTSLISITSSFMSGTVIFYLIVRYQDNLPPTTRDVEPYCSIFMLHMSVSHFKGYRCCSENSMKYNVSCNSREKNAL